jgi:hypothetical protein
MLASNVFGREFIQDSIQLLIGDSCVDVRIDVRSAKAAIRSK